MAKEKPPGPKPGKTWDGLSFLTCDRLGDLDHGFAREVIDQSLSEISNDVDQRGGDGKPRQVTIVVTLTKIGDRGDVKVDFECKTAVPARTLESTIGILRKDGNRPSVAYRPDNTERPDQPTIPYDGDDAGKGE